MKFTSFPILILFTTLVAASCSALLMHNEGVYYKVAFAVSSLMAVVSAVMVFLDARWNKKQSDNQKGKEEADNREESQQQ